MPHVKVTFMDRIYNSRILFIFVECFIRGNIHKKIFRAYSGNFLMFHYWDITFEYCRNITEYSCGISEYYGGKSEYYRGKSEYFVGILEYFGGIPEHCKKTGKILLHFWIKFEYFRNISEEYCKNIPVEYFRHIFDKDCRILLLIILKYYRNIIKIFL